MLAKILLLHTGIELTFGLLFLISPESIPVRFFHNLPPAGLHIACMYGYAALAMAVLGFQTWWHYPDRKVLLVALPALATFHTGIALAQISNPMNSSEPYLAGVFHSMLGFAFLMYYLRER
jgi:hypothetical protein